MRAVSTSPQRCAAAPRWSAAPSDAPSGRRPAFESGASSAARDTAPRCRSSRRRAAPAAARRARRSARGRRAASVPASTSVIARAANVAAERDEHRAGLGRRAELADTSSAPCRAIERDVRERLDVLHERRASADAALVGSRRHEGRLRGPAVQPLHERRLLAGHEAVGERRRARSARASGRAAALGDGGGHAVVRAAPSPRADGDHDLAGADGGRGCLGAIQHEVRVAAHEERVLVARRLSLDAVARRRPAPRPAATARSLSASESRRRHGRCRPLASICGDQRVRSRRAAPADGRSARRARQRGRAAGGAEQSRQRRRALGAGADASDAHRRDPQTRRREVLRRLASARSSIRSTSAPAKIGDARGIDRRASSGARHRCPCPRRAAARPATRRTRPQCTPRHARSGIRSRRRLVTTSAITRSSARAASPSQIA